MTNKGLKFQKLNSTQVVVIDKLLREVCEKSDDGICSYISDWSDARVAEEAIPNYEGSGAGAVGRLRRQLGYGQLRRGRPAGFFSRVSVLEARVAKIEAWIEEGDWK
jgi:hypothetical protein